MVTEFTGLPGVKRRTIKGTMADTPRAIVESLRKHRACSAAGDTGAITVWIDDAGDYRCAFSQFMSVKEQQAFKTKIAVHRWLKVWMPKMFEGYA